MEQVFEHNGSGKFSPEIEPFKDVELTFDSLYKGRMNYKGEKDNKIIYVSFEFEYRDEFSLMEKISSHTYDDFTIIISDTHL